MKILITGATGFIGNELIEHFPKEQVTLFSRSVVSGFTTLNYSLEDLLAKECIHSHFDVAVHLAGLAHSSYSLNELRRINVEATIELATQLAKNGLKRFIFISSIGVNGNRTVNGAFNESSKENPHADYALSKYEAEQRLTELSKKLNFELVIIRPPLVYGKGAPGNFKSLYKIAKKGIPLPFGMVNNSRSLISVANLSDFIALATLHPEAANQLFTVCDGDDMSTKKLVKLIWKIEGRRSFLIPVPIFLFKFFFRLIGRESVAIQLFDDLKVDNNKSIKLLGWKPVKSFFETLT